MNATVKKLGIGFGFLVVGLIVLQTVAGTTIPVVSTIAKKATGKA